MTKTQPRYCIKSFRFKDFKGIKHAEIKDLPKGAPWIFLTGENGYGKTSILQAISASIASWRTEEENLPSQIKPEDVRRHNFMMYPERKFSIYRYPVWLACYGSSRLDTYTESSKIGNNITDSIFNTRTLLENIEYQLTRWYAKKDADEEFRAKYMHTRQLLIDILQIKDIEIDFKTDEVFYVEQDAQGESYQRLPLLQLASGYRSLIAMVGDMILRLFRTQPDVHNPSDLEGIVIIDELDLHFHPKWQKRLPEILTKHFPKIQFIASTHSPIPFLGAPEGSVFLTVNRSKEMGITVERSIHLEEQIATLTPNLLLDSFLFGYSDLYSTHFQQNQEIETSDTFQEKAYRENLERSLGQELPEDKQEALRKLLKAPQ